MLWGGSSALLSVCPIPSFARSIFLKPTRALWLYNTHTGETLKEVYWSHGLYLKDSLTQINRILRDHRVNEVKSIDPAVLDLVHTIQQLMDYRKPLDIISGYRSPKTNAWLRRRSHGVSKNSYHMKGKALDISFRGLLLARAQKAACSLRRGGVGYYPASGFIHVDVRKRPTCW